MLESRGGFRLAGLVDRVRGVERRAGTFSELARPYAGFVSRAHSYVQIAFFFLPPELYTNPELLQGLGEVKAGGGTVELIIKPNAREISKESISALSGVGADVLVDRGYQNYDPFTIIDGRGLALHLPVYPMRRDAEAEQVLIPNAREVEAYAEKFAQLKENSVPLE